jgi:hypothetical protein
LIPDQHALGVLKRTENDSSGISQTYLEHRVAILAPPALAHRGMVIA